MTINRGAFGKSLWPGIKTWYGETYAEYPEIHTSLFEKETSDKAFEEEVGYSGFGVAAQINEGESVVYDEAMQGFVTRYNMLKYGLGFIITSEMIDDDQYMIVAKKRAKALAYSMRQTKEIIGHNVYNLAFTGGPTYGDGVSMINSAHPLKSGGTSSNVLSTPADLSEAALEQAVIDLMLFTNDRGLRIQTRPKKLVIPVQLVFDAQRILKSPLRSDSADNDINALKHLGYFENIIVSPYLTSSKAWYVLTDCPDGLKYFERKADDFKDDSDFDSDNLKYKATARYAFGVTDWRAIYGSPGA
jgi:hypothetical protein